MNSRTDSLPIGSDFEATSSDNVGFALPDIIRAASHLRYLSIRPRTILPSHSFPSRQRRLRDYEEWNSYTGESPTSCSRLTR
jgi:hypothetical protein